MKFIYIIYIYIYIKSFIPRDCHSYSDVPISHGVFSPGPEAHDAWLNDCRAPGIQKGCCRFSR